MAEGTEGNAATMDVKAIVKDAVTAAVAEALKGVPEIVRAEIKPLAENQKVLADTLAKLPPAGVEKKDAEAATAQGGGADKPLTRAELAALLDERDKARRTGDETAARKQAARQRVVDAKLKDVPPEFLAGLPDTDDEAQLSAAADKAIARFNEVAKVKPADVGGAGKDGGKTPASEGQGGKGGFLKMPGAAPATA